MAIQAGKIAFVITSDEPVFVLDIEPADEGVYPSLDQEKATVRRPIGSNDGLRHSVDVFYVQELESFEDKAKRQIAEMKAQRAAFSGKDDPSELAGIGEDTSMLVN